MAAAPEELKKSCGFRGLHDRIEHDSLNREHNNLLERAGRQHYEEAVAIEHGNPERVEEQIHHDGIHNTRGKNTGELHRPVIQYGAHDDSCQYGIEGEAGEEGTGRLNDKGDQIHKPVNNAADNRTQHIGAEILGQEGKADLDGVAELNGCQITERDCHGGKHGGIRDTSDILKFPEGIREGFEEILHKKNTSFRSPYYN